MFNESIKNEFINFRLENNDTPFAPNYLNNWFEKAEEFEEKFNKDLCNFTKDELMDFYKSVGSSSYLTLRAFNYQMMQYFDWCKEKGLTSKDVSSFEEISKEELDFCVATEKKEASLITREELENWCDYDIQNSRDQFIMLCLFEGLKGKNYSEIINLSRRDLSIKVDENGKKTYFAEVGDNPSRKIPVSEKLYYTAISAYDTNDYVTFGTVRKIFQLKANGSKIFKGFMNQNFEYTSDFQKGRVLASIVKRNVESLSLSTGRNHFESVTPSSIRLSGMVHFIKTRSAELGITPTEYISQEAYRDEINYQYGSKVSKVYFEARAKEFLQ